MASDPTPLLPRDGKTGVLFVCLGNICRSPLAKVIFADLARTRGVLDRFTIDSCGTGGWHAGGPADPRSVQVAAEHGLTLDHIARRVWPPVDFDQFDWLVAMDRANKRDLLSMGAPATKVALIRSFDQTLAGKPEREMEVPDPYSGGDGGFEIVYQMLVRGCEGFLENVTRSP